jgi:hypothetical protein
MLRGIEPARAVVLRISGLPSRFAETWHAAGEIARVCGGALVHGTPARGIARIIAGPGAYDSAATADALARTLDTQTSHARICERLPAALWPRVAPSPVSHRLARDIRAAFDPAHILNPGIFGEGAA